MAAGGFVNRAFESMLKECSSTKKYPDLQKAIQTYIDCTKVVPQPSKSSDETAQVTDTSAGNESATQSDGGASKTELDQSQTQEGISRNITTVLANAGCSLEGSEAELVLYPLRLAVETKNLKILEPALDCLHKLIAYNHLEGDPGLDGGKNVPLFTDILNMVCNCVDNSSPDSTILQVLKVLLTAVASTKFRVHGEPLLGVIRICYNIALHSKSPINQATSKAMLTQMISIVFRRMETDPQSQVSISSGSNGNAEAASAEKLTVKVEETPAADQNEEGMSLGDALNQVKETSFASVKELHNLAGGADIKGLEAVLGKAVHTDGKKITWGIDLESMNVAQRDALLVFRTLCKMGMKEDNDEVTTKRGFCL